jgi:hypothetical protein
MQIKTQIKMPRLKGNHPPTFRMPTEIKKAHTPMQDAHHISHAYGKKKKMPIHKVNRPIKQWQKRPKQNEQHNSLNLFKRRSRHPGIFQ